MKREIKFRGISKIYGCWRFGDLYRTNLEGGVAIQFYDEVDGWMTEDVNPKTIGQFTGIKDGNGTEIFEGDILKCRIKKFEHIPYVVGYRLGLFETRPNNQNLASSPLKYLLNDDDEGTALKSWTIIGNIHDNPELMEAAAK